MTSVSRPVQIALQEDMPDGDITTDSLQLKARRGLARVVAKEDLVLSGTSIFSETFRAVDPNVAIEWQFTDGTFVLKGQTVCLLRGPVHAILKGERVALNFLGHLSGIASLTRCYAEQVQHTKTKILDTRKTLPGLRDLEKAAVVHGGGCNHRMNLSDGVLIKENHISLAGGLKAAIDRVRDETNLPIEIEVRNLTEVREAVELKVWRILLDNMSNDEMREALHHVHAGIETEASGNMTLGRVREVAELGVDYISVGAITHSAPCADLSLLLESVDAPRVD